MMRTPRRHHQRAAIHPYKSGDVENLSAVLVAREDGHFYGIPQPRTLAGAFTGQIARVVPQSRRHAVRNRPLDGVPAKARSVTLREAGAGAGPTYGSASDFSPGGGVQRAKIRAGACEIVVFILLPPFGSSHRMVCRMSGNRG